MDKIKALLQENAGQIETPCYLYSVSQVAQNYQALSKALGTKLIFSMKANNNADLLMRASHHLDGGIEVASIGELNLVAGGDSEKFINNPSADKKFLRAAVASRSTIILDNLVQLEALREFVGKRPLKPVLLRINSSVLKRFNQDLPNIRADQFGMDWDTVTKAIRLCREFDIPLAGFHLFNGSYSFTKAANATAVAAIAILAEMERLYDQALSFVNLGGGFSEQWQEQGFDFESYRQLLGEFPAHITLAHETGRGLMASAGYFAARVRYTKQIEGNHFAICDGGINQNFLLAQTENTFRKLKTPLLWRKPNADSSIGATSDETEKGACTYVGSSCSKDDVIGKQTDEHLLPQAGDICVYDHCGAYNASYTVTPFLKLPQAKTYIIE
ncbi:amino acid decarboxylase [Marinomonas sp. SBI22]|uniref:PLP-dependent decarboxylase n=1 Tax=unclassified Marinomonas TaxID=196814 RepID=UPI0007AFB1D7|nr:MULTISPECIES: PLP-dependent decarboxylase [unclassified Marinomonas]KZM42521.1 amino acid decarboxylase [Marinomonas sp. SBI22]KZM43915.1 amino acid decarboxylase [Marinomonas sp. SBI8L]